MSRKVCWALAVVVLAGADAMAQTAGAPALEAEVFGIHADRLRADDLPRLIGLQTEAELLGARGESTDRLVNYLVQLRKLAQLQDTLHTPVRDAQGRVVPLSQIEAEVSTLREELRRLAPAAEGLPLPTRPTPPTPVTPATPEVREFLNREVSFVEFNRRVVAQAHDTRVPLLERARFLSIASSNLDEFFGVRVSGLKQEVRVGREAPRSDGYSPQETYRDALLQARTLVEAQYEAWNTQVVPALRREGVELQPRSSWSAETRAWAAAQPLPELVVHELRDGELPRLADKALYLVVYDAEQRPLRLIEVPQSGSQVLRLPGEGTRLVLFSDVVAAQAELRGGAGVGELRVTRNADSWGRPGTPDHRYGEPVRLEVGREVPAQVVERLRAGVGLSADEVIRVNGPVDLQRLGDLIDQAKQGRGHLLHRGHTPSTEREYQRLFETLSQRDVLVHTPFQSFQPVIDFVAQAARDAHVTEIRQTLYRTGGPNTPVVDALVAAAEAGKRVVVIVELKARFDEVNNLRNVERLRAAGVEVHFGPVGHKVHAKAAQVVRVESGVERVYSLLSTGNFNAGSARFYTDLSYMTKSEAIARDVSAVFQELTGQRTQAAGLTQVLRAPFTMQSSLVELIEAEAQAAREGREARIVMKMNSLNDPTLIRALYAASQAGVQIDLIVRGICTLRPGVPGLSETIRVRSVIGRLLEHSRVYQFHAGGEQRTWIGSADLMVRNTERRVETAVEIRDAAAKAELDRLLRTYLADNRQAWRLRPDGTYERVEAIGPERVAQEELIERHRPRAPAPSAELLAPAPANWAQELRTVDAGLREVHQLGLEIVESSEPRVRGTAHGTVEVTTGALEAFHRNALADAGSGAERAAERRGALAEAVETAASELLAREKGAANELYRRGVQARVAQGQGAEVQAGETTARTALGWLANYRRADMTLDRRAMARDGVTRTLSSTGKFTLAIFLREFGYAVATRDRGRLEDFFAMVATTDFYVHYGMFVGGAFAGEVAYDVLHRRYLKRYLADGVMNRLARSNAALAGGLALPMLIDGTFEGRTFAISLGSLGISAVAVQGAMSRIPWVRRLQSAAAVGGRVARVGGWVYQAGELAIVLTIGGEIERYAHTKIERWEAAHALQQAAQQVVLDLGREGHGEREALDALIAYAHAWDAYRLSLYGPLFQAQHQFKEQLQPFLRQEARRDTVAQAAGRLNHDGLDARMVERLEALAQSSDQRRDDALRALVEAYDDEFQEALAVVYAADGRAGAFLPADLPAQLQPLDWTARAERFADAHGNASEQRLQTYVDEREALDVLAALVDHRYPGAFEQARWRADSLASEEAEMFRAERRGLTDALPD